MKTRAAVLYAPGTNCHKETLYAITELLGCSARLVMLKKNGRLSCPLKNFTHLIIPGGFSFGDHFGAGRVAAILIKHGCVDELKEFLSRGGKILGICNGFQILCELGFLPGALAQNDSRRFRSCWVDVKFQGKILHLPAAHAEGRLILQDDRPVYPLMYYIDNPNGSERDIAGLTDSPNDQIWGLMPHPERACLPQHKSEDGLVIFRTFLESVSRAVSSNLTMTPK